MSLYHVLVQHEDGWYVGRVLERAGVTTQGKTLDELVFMLRDAIELMWNERHPSLELVLSGKTPIPRAKPPKRRAKSRREAA